MWPTGRTVAILDIEIRPVKDRSQESSCPDAVRTAGWWFQQAAQRLRAVSNRGPQAACRSSGDGPGLAEAVADSDDKEFAGYLKGLGAVLAATRKGST